MENEEKREEIVAENQNKIMNRLLHCAVYIVLAAFGFSCGYRIGISNTGESAVIDEAVVNTDTEAMAEIWYEVCIEGSRLSLYRMSDRETVLMASEEISTQVFPNADRSELENGLIFESFDAALSCFEDFVS